MHKLWDPKHDKARSILLKFLRCIARSRGFRKIKKLKGKKVSITEGLVKTGMEALRRVLKVLEEYLSELHNVWTYVGEIRYKDVNDNKIKNITIRK